MQITLDQIFIDKMSLVLQKSLADTVAPLGITATCKDPSAHTHFTDVVMCAIGITGAFNGNLTIIIPQKTACQFVSKMLGSSYDEVTDDVLDGCREITNMVAGVVKMEMAAQSIDISIGLPTSIIGQAMHMRFNPSDKNIHQQYASLEGDLEMYMICRESQPVQSSGKPTEVKKDAASALLEKMKQFSQKT